MSRTRPPQNNAALLGALDAAHVEFAIIGGVAAALHGATRLTIDLDIVMPFDEANLARLVDAMRPHAPVHATRTDLSLLDEPMARLMRFRMFLIETRLGRLDVLRSIEPCGEYDRLDTVEMTVHGRIVRVLALQPLIAVKRATGRRKDIEVALELEAIAEGPPEP